MTPDGQDVLLSKARSVFMSYGYHGTSVRRLMRELNISEKEFYDLLGGKRALVEKLIAQESVHWERILEKARERSNHDAREEIKTVIDSLLRSHLEEASPKGSFLANIASEMTRQDDEVQRQIAGCYNDMVRGIADILRRIGPRLDKGNDREIALFVLSALEGSAILAKADNDFWEIKNGFDMTKRFIDGL